MPIWLRKFTAEKIREQYEKEAEAQQEAYEKQAGIQKATPQSSKSIEVPDAVRKATYTTKAAKK